MLSDGDMKKIINYTQTISVCDTEAGSAGIETFYQIFNVPPLKLLEQMLIDSLESHTQAKALQNVTFLLEQGYAYSDILEMLSKILAYTETIPDHMRFKYLERLSEYYCNMTQQTHEVHLYSLFANWASYNKCNDMASC